MEYRLVMSDLDGTLVDNDHRLLPETEKSLRDLVESGRLFAIGSARRRSYLRNTYPAFSEVCCAHACTNGTYVETSDGDILVDAPFEGEDLSLLIEECYRIKASFICCSQTISMAKTYSPSIAEEFEYFHGKFLEEEAVDKSMFKAYLMSVVTTEPEALLNVVSNHLPKIEPSPVRTLPDNGASFLFLQRKGVNKATALQAIADHYGVVLSETMAFGDDVSNDAPMIELAGCGVAVKNAHEIIIDKADRVTEKDNTQDGVGDFLRGFLGI